VLVILYTTTSAPTKAQTGAMTHMFRDSISFAVSVVIIGCFAILVSGIFY
jgi:hypothetical protein